MSQVFDITEEELPIFQAEAEEHLQVLEEGLVRLEREKDDTELVQAIFRAAHTLKGSAGMIGHKRMVDLTHALETILDGVRKNNMVVNADIIDTCLQSLDYLQSLCLEVVYPDHEEVDVSEIVQELSELV